MTAKAKAIGEGDLSERIPEAAEGTEAGDPAAQNPMDDELIHRALRCELDAQPWWSPSQCAFIVSDGVVHFHGLVESQDGVRAARVAAERIPGVRGIVDRRLDTSAWGWLAR